MRGSSSWAGKFPNDPIFNYLHEIAGKVHGTVVYDEINGIEADYARFSHDMSRLCTILREKLPPSAFNERGLFQEKSPYVAVLVTGGYEFLVSFYAILALGGACVPLGEQLASPNIVIPEH